MNDQILMENMLLLLKSNTETYIHASLESSNKNIQNVIKNGLDETIKMHDELYNKMTEFGWYTIENIETKAIKQTLKKLKNKN